VNDSGKEQESQLSMTIRAMLTETTRSFWLLSVGQ